MTHFTCKPLHRGPTLKFLRKFFKTWTFGLKNIILYAKFEKIRIYHRCRKCWESLVKISDKSAKK